MRLGMSNKGLNYLFPVTNLTKQRHSIPLYLMARQKRFMITSFSFFCQKENIGRKLRLDKL